MSELLSYHLAPQQALLPQEQCWKSFPKPLLALVTWQMGSDLRMTEEISLPLL